MTIKWLFLATVLVLSGCAEVGAGIGAVSNANEQAIKNAQDAADAVANLNTHIPCATTVGALGRLADLRKQAAILDLCFPDWRDVLAAASVANRAVGR